jgi:hypothetical protein
VLVHVGLAEEDAALGVEARREQDCRRVVDKLGQLPRVERNGQRVQVDDAVDRLAAVLPRDVLDDRADVVAEVLAPVGWMPEKIRMRGRLQVICGEFQSAWRRTGCLAAPASSRRRTGVV